jgi:hypothetical protein
MQRQELLRDEILMNQLVVDAIAVLSCAVEIEEPTGTTLLTDFGLTGQADMTELAVSIEHITGETVKEELLPRSPRRLTVSSYGKLIVLQWL